MSGVHADAATWLVKNRNIRGVGIDTPSIDYGLSKTFPSHQILYEANIYGLENVANLDQLPATGYIVYALPMKIVRGSGGPVRILATMKPVPVVNGARASYATGIFAVVLVMQAMFFVI